MILNSDRTRAISTLGWVDRGAIWVYSVDTGAPRRILLSDAKYLTLFQGLNDFFAVVHHYNGASLEITAHAFSKPADMISRISVRAANPTEPFGLVLIRDGRQDIWDHLPAAFTAYASGDYRLILTRYPAKDAIQTFAWFDSSYDKMYQGIVAVTEVPNTSLLIVSVQRDSNPVLYDPETRTVVRKLSLANRGGNPKFQLRATADELWADDYDTVVKLDAKTLELTGKSLVQDADPGTAKFVGDFCFDAAQKFCLVARPFSGDIATLNADSLTQVSRTYVGGQPLTVGLLADGRVVARDWKSGELLAGTLRH